MLPDPGDENPLVLLTHVYRDSALAFSHYMGMSMSRIELLHELFHGGELSQSALAQRLTMEGSLITRFAKQMEAAGLITRRVDPTDNRFTLVKLAPAGSALLEQLGTVGEELQQQILAGVSAPDLGTTMRVMRRIQANIAALDPPQSRPA